ncbi:DUF222 domain-containing protein [Microbacterium sp. A82]|uniref:HNH endonuclease n=1 Tax=Microbacterium sp. A82 TaxID=3450452 RepID=UPI003F310D90
MSQLTAIHEALNGLDAVWADAGDSNILTREQLIAAETAVGLLQRRLDALHVDVAAGIAHESRTELGPDSLAKQQGFRTAAKLIAATTGVSSGDAFRLIKVGEGTAPRSDLLGNPLPAKYQLVREALASGELSAQAAAMIITLLDRCRVAAGVERIAEGERVLTENAVGLSLDELRKLIVRAEAWLDPDGIEPREEERRSKRFFNMFERDGELHFSGKTDIESGAPILAAFRGFVSAAFAARKDAVDPNAPDADRRSVAMIQADAFAAFCSHVLGCDSKLPLAGATVIVRISLQDLISGAGWATIDGADQPVSVSAARRMAAGDGIIPCVLGGDSEILDWGRKKRLFTRAQRLALVERDGGCAMCALPPEMTKAHHIRWWQRHHGRTDLMNGVLLCETCHHRIHDNGWEVNVVGVGAGARVWFIPPNYVDPAREPRLGGRARFDIAA